MNKDSTVTNGNSDKTILVVDDTVANLELVISFLKKEGYKSLMAKSGEKALVRAEKMLPDLILLDIRMPGIDGYETCRKLKENRVTRDIPVIFMTSLTETDDKVKGFEAGAVDYITKPIDCVELQARIETHISLYRAKKELIKQNEILTENTALRETMEQIMRHDLKSPLSGILFVPQLLLSKKNTNLTELQITQIKRIEKAALTMLDMINRYMDIYKMEKDIYRPELTGVDIISVIKSVIEMTVIHDARRNTEISITYNGEPVDEDTTCFITGEEMLFYSLYSNLLTNALEATPPDKTICVSIEQTEEIVIRITNHGSVPESIRDTFFDKFITAGKNTGLGLGTYSAKLMAETLKGSITLDCSVPDKTTLETRFPCPEEPAS